MSDTDDYSLDGDEAEEPELPASNSTDWEAEARKAFAARDKVRLELHRTKLQIEYGNEIAEMIPEGLPPKEWKTYADKLMAFRGPTEPPVAPETSAEEAPAEPDVPDAEKLAGIVNGPSGSASAGSGSVSRAEWMNLVNNDSAEAERLFKSGKVDFSDIRQGLGPDR